ncbi:hypothetical protein ACIQGZ_08430 [Streptomyces sp. NPDC092296]|uniref:hypothetical protein n=1 Tax=Streptomyces sp. NPDC092296 TaxID=3366012 RepID=UPI0038225BB6
MTAAMTASAAITAAFPAEVTSAAATSAAPPKTQQVAYFADRPLSPAKAVPASVLPAEARAQLAGKSVTPNIATPRGYRLREGGLKTAYIYQSAYVWAIEASCGANGCKPVQQVKLHLKENAVGKTSKRWTLTLYAGPWSGPSSFSLRYYYECGVNISKSQDKTCSSWRHDHADGSASSAAHNGTTLNHGFGSTNNVTKFPLVRFDVRFANGSSAVGDDGHTGEKFRGWDVCVRARTTRMCPKTGTGG